jgi:hypothetical protein
MEAPSDELKVLDEMSVELDGPTRVASAEPIEEAGRAASG